jgi:hypothetical protein
MIMQLSQRPLFRHERASVRTDFQLAETITALRYNVPSGAALTATLIGTVRHLLEPYACAGHLRNPQELVTHSDGRAEDDVGEGAAAAELIRTGIWAAPPRHQPAAERMPKSRKHRPPRP